MQGQESTNLHQMLERSLRQHIGVLAGEIGERHLLRPEALAASVDYITGAFQTHGLPVALQEVRAYGRTVNNIEVRIPGRSAAAGTLVLGAHYDSVPGSPAANDNASGVAALLEIGRLCADMQFPAALRLVAFVNEEPPFFRTASMGSLVYAERLHSQRERLAGMISLETIGHYTQLPGSQSYPFPFSPFYPGVGNFVGFVGNLRSFFLTQRSVSLFRKHSCFPAEWLVAPGWIMGLGWSDHWAFWRYGYQAIMVTDTAFFRYPHYHQSSDTPDRINYPALTLLVQGLVGMVGELAGGGELRPRFHRR